MGSVKDLEILEAPTPDRMGRGRFVFSDRYSVFDWGEMPDRIAAKGAALCLTAAWFFERLEAEGVPTHYVGVVEDGRPKRLAELRGPSCVMEVRLVNVLRPVVRDGRYDYAAFVPGLRNVLVPLEAIYRNRLPEGSSVFRRLAKGETTPEELGLPGMPVPGQALEPPLVDFSTKLEVTDRYLRREEARRISGLDGSVFDLLVRTVRQVERTVTEAVAALGLVNEDGKMEFGVDADGGLMLVDVVGTPDECRFTLDGVPVGKEVCRIWYRRTPWYAAVERAKAEDRLNWRGKVGILPGPLPSELAELVSLAYRAFCDGVTGRRWFGAPPLAEVVGAMRRFL